MGISLQLAQARLKTERWRENHRYREWLKWHNKRPQNSKTTAERAKWWGLYTDAHIKRLSLEHLVHEKTPKFRPGKEMSTKGVNFIKAFEGYVGHVYNDGTGVMTVGYGHTENVPGNGVWLPHQKHRGFLTEAEASELLRRDLNQHYAPYVANLGLKMDDNQFTGWVSFVYNVGPGGIQGGTVGRLLRQGNQHAAANAILGWVHAGGNVLPGLVRRREAERRLILH